MASKRETPAEKRTKAALQQAEGRTVSNWNYAEDGSGLALFFSDGTNLQIDITYEREIVGVQGEPCLTVHFGEEKRKNELRRRCR